VLSPCQLREKETTVRQKHPFIHAMMALFLTLAGLHAQQTSTGSTEKTMTADRLITFNGTVKDANGQPRLGALNITFRLYATQEEGEALWTENQTVQTGQEGRYTVLLGSAAKDGLPLEAFSGGKAQWLGVQVEGQDEEARVLLVAVPYALKAADSDTVGGKPSSSFVLFEDLKEALGMPGSSALTLAQIANDPARSSRASNFAGRLFRGASSGMLASSKTGGLGPLTYNETGINTWFGQDAGKNTTAGPNSYFGYMAGYTNVSGQNNSFFGYRSGYFSTGTSNAFFGHHAGYQNTDGSGGTFIGSAAGYNNTTGDYNVNVGISAGFTGSSAGYNTFVGTYAGYANTGNSNSFFGYYAGRNNSTATGNSFFGRESGQANTSGTGLAFFGYLAGTESTGSDNSFFGYQAGRLNVGGTDNSFFGFYAGRGNTSGDYNSFFGGQAGYQSTTGNRNSGFGYRAAYGNTAGNYNVFLGSNTGASMTVEHNNSFVGAYSDGAAGITNATAIGYQALVTQSNSLVLGSINGVNGATSDTKVGIGTTTPAVKLDIVGGMRIYPLDENEAGLVLSNQSAPAAWQFADYNSGKFYIQEAGVGPRMVIAPGGNVGIGTTDPTSRLYVAGTVYATGGFSAPSDERLKRAIKPISYGLNEVLRLRPVTFEWKDQNDGKLNLGLIAQEVEVVIPEVVEKKMGETGTMGMQYSGLIPVLIKAAQEQQSFIQELKSALDQKSNENASLNARLSALEQALERLTREDRLSNK
jgi:hypothetical protein